MSTLMQIVVNGESRQVPDGTTVAALIQSLQLEPRRVAVECNRQLVPRSAHERTLLRESDQLEIVTLVGGG